MDSVDQTQVDNIVQAPSIRPSEYKGVKNRPVIFTIEGYQGEFKVSTKVKDVTITVHPESGVFILEPVNTSKRFQIEVNLVGINKKIVVPVELEHQAVPELNIKSYNEDCGEYSIAYGPIEFTIDNADYENTKGLPEVSINGKYVLEHADGVYTLSPEDFGKDVDICIAGGYDKDGAKLVHYIHGVIFRSRVREAGVNQQFPIRATVDGNPNAEFRIDGMRLNTDDEELTPNWLHYGPMKGNTITIRTWINLNNGSVRYINSLINGTEIRGGYADADGPRGGHVVYNDARHPGGGSHNYSVTSDWDKTKDSKVTYRMGFDARVGWNYPHYTARAEFDLNDMGIEFVPYAPPVDFDLNDIKVYEDKIIDKSDTSTPPVERKLGNVVYPRTLKPKVVSGDIELTVVSLNTDGTGTITITPKNPGVNNNFIQGKVEIKSKGNKPITKDVVLCPELVIDDQNPPSIFNKIENPKGEVTEHPLKPHFGIWSNGMQFPKATLLEGDAQLTFKNGNASDKFAVLTGGESPVNKFKLEGYWYNLPFDMDANYKMPRVITVTGEQDPVTMVYYLDKKDKTKQTLKITCLDGPSLKYKITKGKANDVLKPLGKDKYERFEFELTLGYKGSDNLEIEFTCDDHPDVKIQVKYRLILSIVTDEDMYTYVKALPGESNKHTIRVYDVNGQLQATNKEGDVITAVTHVKNDEWLLDVDYNKTDFNRILLEADGNNPKEIIVFFIERPNDTKEDFIIKSHATGKEVIGDTIKLEVLAPQDVQNLKGYTVTTPSNRCKLALDGQFANASTDPKDGKDPLKTYVVFSADDYNSKAVEVIWNKFVEDTKPPVNPNPGDPNNPGGGNNNNNGGNNGGGGGNTGGVTPPTGPTEGIRPPVINTDNLYKTTISNKAIHVLKSKPEEVTSVRVYSDRIGYYFTKIGDKDVIMFYIYGGPGKAAVIIEDSVNGKTEFEIEFIYDGNIYHTVSSYTANLEENVYIDLELIAGDGTIDNTNLLGAEDIYNPHNLGITLDPANPNRLVCRANEPGVYHILLYKYGYKPVYVKPIVFTMDIVHLEYDYSVNYVGEEVDIRIKGTNPQNASVYLLKGNVMELEQDEQDPTKLTLRGTDSGRDRISVSMPGGYSVEYPFEYRDPKEVTLEPDMAGKYWLSQNAYVTIPEELTYNDLVFSNPTVKTQAHGPNQIILSATEPGECTVAVNKRGYAGEVLIEWEKNQTPEITIDNPQPTFDKDEEVEVTVQGIDTNYDLLSYHKSTGTKAKVTGLGNGKFKVSGNIKGTYVITCTGYCIENVEVYFFVDTDKGNVENTPSEEESTPDNSTPDTNVPGTKKRGRPPKKNKEEPTE